MNRKKFIGIVGGTVIVVATTAYLLSDKSNLVRADIKPVDDTALSINMKYNIRNKSRYYHETIFC